MGFRKGDVVSLEFDSAHYTLNVNEVKQNRLIEDAVLDAFSDVEGTAYQYNLK